MELLDGVRSSWSHGAPPAGPRSAGPPVYHTATPPAASSIPNDSMSFAATPSVDDGNYGGAVRTPPPPPPTSINRRLSTRQGSSDSLSLARRVSTRQASTDSNASSHLQQQQRVPRRVPSAASIQSTGSTSTAATNPAGVAPPAARRPPSPPARRKRRALYDFAGETTDELTFTAGSVITVLEEVDEGWWLGELDGQRGIFPVNYTESVSPPMPARPNTTTAPPTVAPTALVEHPEEDEAADSPFHDEYATPARLASPPAPTAAASSTASHYQHAIPVHTKPSFSSSSRTPPPAPSSQQYQHQPSSVSTPLSISSRSTPASTPQAVRTPAVDYFASQTQQEDASHAPPCQECGCIDFSPNVFKKGQCKMCFHAHT